MSGDFISFLNQNCIEYKENVLMKNLTSIKIGGNADFLVLPNTDDKAIKLIDWISEHNFPHKTIGRMSNILPCDDNYRGALISTKRLSSFRFEEKSAICHSGASIFCVLREALKSGLGGAESLSHIPGTIGGMIYSNAGAFGKSISDFLVEAEVYFPYEKSRRTVTKEELAFSYRKSSLCGTDNFILSAKLIFDYVDKNESSSLAKEFLDRRKATQPTNMPSLGSIFKAKPIPASKLIDDCGLKGARIGGAMISQKHAGFIVNAGGASASDVRELIKLVENTVYSKYGISLEKEIEFL